MTIAGVLKTTIDNDIDEFFKPEFFFSSLVIRTSFFKTGTWWRIENQHWTSIWSGCHNILFRQKLWIRHLALRLITHVVRLLHLCKMSEKVALVRADWRRGGRPAMCAHFEKYHQPKIVVNVQWRAHRKILSIWKCQRPTTCTLTNIIFVVTCSSWFWSSPGKAPLLLCESCVSPTWGKAQKKNRFFLGKSPKLWVGGGQES